MTRMGSPSAAPDPCIRIQDLERLEEIEDARAVHEALAEYGRGETVSWEQVKAQLKAR